MRCIFFSRYTCVAYIAAAVDSIVSTRTAEVRQDYVEKGISPRCLTIAFFFHCYLFDVLFPFVDIFHRDVIELSYVYRIREAFLEDQKETYVALLRKSANS